MASNRTILITGVTGHQGGAVARASQGVGFHLRGLTRKPDGERGGGHAATRDPLGAERRDPMVDLTSYGVSVALLLGQLLAGEISRSALLDRASPLGARISEAAAVADKVFAIAENQAMHQKDLKGAGDAERRQAMPNSISTLLTRNLHDVFGENDPKRRRAAINEIFTADCVFYEPGGGVYRGRDEIDRVAGALRATHPDFRYQPVARPEEVGNGGRVQWVEGRPGEAPAHAGTDFIVARDGRIATVYLFFDKHP